MNDESHQHPTTHHTDDQVSETVFCIKQEPLEIETDDPPNDKCDPSVGDPLAFNDSLSKELELEDMPTRVVDGHQLEPVKKRKRVSKKVKVKELDPATKQRSKSKKLKALAASSSSFDGSENENSDRSDGHGEASSESAPVCGPSEHEVGLESKVEIVDVSGFVVRLEMTYDKGRVMYCCSRCKNTFRKLETGEAHIFKVHSNIKRYMCSDCGRGFDRALDLGEHVKVHTGERPFKCPAENCGYTATWSSTLYKHVRRRHKDYKGDLSLATIATGERRERKRKIESNKIVAHKPAGNAETADETIEAKPDIKNLLLVQIPPVEDVEYDNGQLDLFEEASIIDNRNDEAPHYRCKICSKDFENLFTIKGHVNKAHMDVRKRTCPMCGIILTHSCNVPVHIRSHSGERPFTCEECGTGFITKSDLKRHARRFSHVSGLKNKEHQCIICQEIFDSFDKLEKHTSIHVPRAPDLEVSFQLTPYEEAKLKITESTESTKSHVFTCNICGMLFGELSPAKHHVNDDHKVVKNLSCIYCGSSSSSRDTLKTHTLLHENNKTSKCINPNCNYVTDQVSNLIQHIRDCTGTPSRATARRCTICNVEFGELALLRTHFRTFHKLGKSYSCLHCENSFASPSILTEHLLSHGATQSVVRCPLENCQFIVTTEEDKIQHKQWHEKKINPLPRPFVCGTCGKDFDKNGSLSRHMRNVHSQGQLQNGTTG